MKTIIKIKCINGHAEHVDIMTLGVKWTFECTQCHTPYIKIQRGRVVNREGR